MGNLYEYFTEHPLLKSWHFSRDFSSDELRDDDLLADVFAEIELEKQQEKEDRKRKGLDEKDIDEEDKEDYMGVMPLIEKLEKRALKEKNFLTLDDAFKWMNKIDKFEEKHFKLRPEYRAIGDLMNLLKVTEGKEKFILKPKLNRAMRLLQWKEAYDPNNPANYGIMKDYQVGPSVDREEEAEEENEKKIIRKAIDIVQGGQVVKYAALLACGNYHGVVGYSKSKAVPIALQKVIGCRNPHNTVKAILEALNAKDHVRRIEASEMIMLRWTCGRTLWDMTTNSAIRMSLGVVPVSEKLREGRLRWFGHVLRRLPSDVVRRVESITVDGARRRGQPRRKWEDCSRSDMMDLALTENMTSDRKVWRLKTRIVE
ncbi:Pentatricopeptide repeat-containing protein, putative isoform 1 [Hibiscus syriacus]|uniref:Pentatricopeptide repeat-containing protein, putative isoform 1 n=1 Tax=Hibiscus syriacus TaxID=106335 RepID=A0A6A3AI40_HIBSY|nr:Pentatricopeptide repeat-containing protein, putative isoform 1 [Hibiscus syriacus]